MWNPVAMVAKHFFLPEVEFVKFAMDNTDKYKIDIRYAKRPEVGTLFVDALIKDFQTQYSALCEETRINIINGMNMPIKATTRFE